MLNLIIEGEHPGELAFPVRKMINAGYTGRDQEAVRRHIEELRRHGVAAPEETPTFYPVLPDRVTTAAEIEVLGGNTSGEAEYVLLLADGGFYVGVGSDHTDRKLEEHSILAAKQICPNVLSPRVWRYEEVKERWDQILLRAWVVQGGERQLYQEGRLSAIMSPEELLQRVRALVEGDLTGTIIYSGTLPLLGKEIRYWPRFEAELIDEEAGRSLRCAYEVRPIGWFKGEL